jgi:hypothetical protein
MISVVILDFFKYSQLLLDISRVWCVEELRVFIPYVLGATCSIQR